MISERRDPAQAAYTSLALLPDPERSLCAIISDFSQLRGLLRNGAFSCSHWMARDLADHHSLPRRRDCRKSCALTRPQDDDPVTNESERR